MIVFVHEEITKLKLRYEKKNTFQIVKMMTPLILDITKKYNFTIKLTTFQKCLLITNSSLSRFQLALDTINDEISKYRCLDNIIR